VLHMLLPLHCLHLLLVHWCCARRCCYHHCLHFRSVPRCLKHSAGPGQKLILGGACVADCTCKRSLYVPMSTNFELHGNICHMSYLICPHVSMPIDLRRSLQGRIQQDRRMKQVEAICYVPNTHNRDTQTRRTHTYTCI